MKEVSVCNYPKHKMLATAFIFGEDVLKLRLKMVSWQRRINLRNQNKALRSISSTINAIYVGIILLFLVLTGGVLYTVALQQVDQNTDETMNSLISQKSDYISSQYQDIFEQFYAVTKSNASRNLLDNNYQSGEYYLTLSEEVDDFYYRNASFIDSMYININDYYEIAVSEQQNLADSSKISSLFHPQVPEREGYFWLNNHTDQLFNRTQNVQTMVYYEKNSNGSDKKSTFVVNLKTSFIDDILSELSMDGSYMMLLAPDGYHVPEDAPINAELNNEIYNWYQNGELDQEMQEHSFSNYNLRNKTIGTNKWRIVLVTPYRRLFGSDSNLPAMILSLLAVLAGVIVVIFQLIKTYISNPIEQLAAQMETTESYDEKLVPSKDVPQELAILYETYNNLSDRNTRLVERMEIEQEEKLELELALLHAQISPHFLYNTLYSIKGLVDMEMNEEASEMVLNLSDFLRTSLSRGKEVITIKEELKNIESYLFMMNMRYGDYFDYSINVSEDLLPYSIVKLTLQPLVENAIYHGVMHTREKSMITIGSERVGDDLIMYVEDNGVGMSPEKLNKIIAEFKVPYLSSSREETGVGLRSVDIRVQNRYGKNYGLDISSEENKYTRILVKLPLIKGEGESV